MDYSNDEQHLIDKEATEITAKTSRLPVKTFKFQGHACDYYWGVDLIDFHDATTVSQNKGYKYIMILLDFYSRYVFAMPLKSKDTPEIIKAFDNVFKNNVDPEFNIPRIPTFICSDEESAIMSKDFDSFAKSMEFSVYNAFGKNGVAPVESFIRTFKEKLAFFWTRQRRNWIDHYADIISNYNLSKHSTLINKDGEKVSPHEVYIDGVPLKEETEAYPENPKTKYDLDIGDRVRFKMNKDLSSVKKKSLLPNYSIDVYKVTDIIKTTKNQGRNTRPNIGYRIKSLSENYKLVDKFDPAFGQELRNANKRLFYRNELKKSRLDDNEISKLSEISKRLVRNINNPHLITDHLSDLGRREQRVAKAVNREATQQGLDRYFGKKVSKNNLANAFTRHGEDSDSDYEPSE